MKSFLACLVGAGVIGAVWELFLGGFVAKMINFGSLQTQQIVMSSLIALLGALFGGAVPGLMKKKSG